MEIRIRAAKPAHAGQIANVHIDTWRSTYVDIVPAEYLESLSYRDRESRWADALMADRPDASVFVAETAESEVVGFADGGPENEGNRVYQGELYSIYILKEHQRRGVGRRLVSAVAQHLLAAGMRSMLLWVLKDNLPSRRFYERLGGTKVTWKTISICGADIVEIAYGWKNIASLADRRPDRRE